MIAGASHDGPISFPGEPGIGSGLPPPFAPESPEIRWLFDLNRFGIRPGLARIEGLLADLGHPERTLRTLVVAGTNGKGSTTLLLASLLQAAGYRVGCFTSPHLLRVQERLTLGGTPCDPAHFVAAITRLRLLVEKHEASWFEALTALALEVGRAEGLDWLCCETGLGGRLDATNALPAAATLLTTVSLDHCQILGATRAEIATEKLGLLKPGVPLFCGVDPELRPQVFAAAVQAGSPCHFLDELVRWEEGQQGLDLVTRRRVIRGLPRLAAPVLQRNLALAVLCLEELAAAGVLRAPEDYAAAAAATLLPGRFQQVLARPDWIFDTAHNGEALAASLAAYLARPVRGRRFVLYGSLRDKEVAAGDVAALRECDGVLGTPILLPRSRNSEELETLLRAWDLPAARARIVADAGEALRELARMLRPEDAVLVTGSCFLVAEVLHRLGFRNLEETRRPRPGAERLAPLLQADDGAVEGAER
jgi:dihydrofolate synthase/folylpolyglutamate synthase